MDMDFLLDSDMPFVERIATDDGTEALKGDDDRNGEEGSMDTDDDMAAGEQTEDCFVRSAANEDAFGSFCSLPLPMCFRKGPDKKLEHEGTVDAALKVMSELDAMNHRGQRRSRQPKKRGRRKGSRNKLSQEIEKKLGDATLHYAHGRFKDAISLLTEVVLMAPHLPDAYITLGLVYSSMGDNSKAMISYDIAASINPKDSSLWKRLVNWSIEKGDIDQALKYLDKAIKADQTDVTLRYLQASIYLEKGEYFNAAESYDQIVQICPNNVKALKAAVQLHKRCGHFDRSISMLEDSLKNQSLGADLSVFDMVALLFIERKDFIRALQHIEHAKVICSFGKEFPLNLTIREGVCHAHLGDWEKAEVCFNLLQRENTEHQMDLIMTVADSFVNLQQYESALKYYMMLEGFMANNEHLNSKIAHCYSAMNDSKSAIYFYYKVLQAREDDTDARLALVSHLLGESREDEALALLSPPPNPVLTNEMDVDVHAPWWLNVKVKMKLSHIYRTKGMLEAYVGVIHPIIHESLEIISVHVKAKQGKRLRNSEQPLRHSFVDHETDSFFTHLGSFQRPASEVNLLKEVGGSEEEKISATLAVSESDAPQQLLKQPPLPDLFEDKEHLTLIIDLCHALTFLRRYDEALELIKLTLKIAYKTLPAEKRELFWSLGAKIALNITDPSDGFDFVRYIVLKHPQSIAAWNHYYKLVITLENRLSKHNKFLHRMRIKHKDLVPPMIIVGNQFTMVSQHQIAAREYLEAYKQMPENPLINLCIGTALINLALGYRLPNKHHCITQGLAFLFNNLQLCENSQEALYNIARAYHHIGLVSLAANYYEKVLAVYLEGGSIRDPNFGYCNLHREAAYNLHLIYKNSGANDLARQVLRDYCTL